MKLGTVVFLGATGLVSLTVAGASVEGCGSSTPTTNGSSSSGGSSGGGSSGSSSGSISTGNQSCDDGGACTQQPPSTGSATTSTTPQNFALHHIHLGDESDSQGNPNWYLYGYNLDNKDTAVSSTDVCSLAPNSNKKNQVDGPGGLDNSFGENIVAALLTAVVSNPSATIDNSLAEGHFTVLFDVTGLSGAKGQSATGLTGQIFAGVPFNQGPNSATAVPTFTSADNWPVNPSYVTSTISGTTLTPPVTSKVTFSGAYINNGVFVSGTPTDVTLTLTISGVPLVVPIQHAIITFNTPGADGGAGNISGGIIAGVIDAQTLVTNLQGVAGNIELELCQGSVFQQLATSILQTADIMDDGSNAPGTQCNGISIGVGFDGDEIQQPQVTGTASTGTNPCADGGADGGGAADAGTD